MASAACACVCMCMLYALFGCAAGHAFMHCRPRVHALEATRSCTAGHTRFGMMPSLFVSAPKCTGIRVEKRDAA